MGIQQLTARATVAPHNPKDSPMKNPGTNDDTSPLKQAAAALNAHDGNVQKTLARLADAVLVPLQQERAEGTLAQKTADIPAMATFILDQLDFEDMTFALHAALDRKNLSQHFKSAVADAPEKNALMLKRARELKTQVESVSEEKHIALSSAIESILPPGVTASFNALRGDKSLADEVREVRALLTHLTPEHIAQAMLARDSRTNNQDVIAAIADTAASVTPEKLHSFLTYCLENFDGNDIATLYKRAWEATEEILGAAQKGDFTSPKNPRKVKAFGQSLQQALSVIEEGLDHAGITLPQNLKEAIADYVDSNRMLRQAEAIRQAELAKNGTQNDVAVSAPMNVRRRTKGGPANG